MSALMHSAKLAQRLCANNPQLLCQAARSMAGWNKDFKPSKYPETQKAKNTAAVKYHLLPEEYRPYADDGLGYGDYPKLEIGLGTESKDPYYPYDFPELKRNLHEPLHADIDMYGEDRYSQPEQPRYTTTQYWLTFLGVMAAMFAIYYGLESMKMFRPVAVKQLPGDGKVHYTFEQD